MKIDNTIRHDFINNGLRIEVLIKLITDEIENKDEVSMEYLGDLEVFLKDHLSFIKKIKQ